jgi:hypothetical protein
MASRDKDGERDKPAADLLRRSLASAAGAPGSKTDACPDPEILAAYVERSLDADEAERCNLHFSECARCREQIAALVRSGEFAGTAAEKPSRAPGIPWTGVGHWDWRWLAPATAMLLLVAVVVVFRPPHYPAEKSPKPLVAMNQAVPPSAEPREDLFMKSGPAPAAAAGAPNGSVAPSSRMRSAPNVSSDKSQTAPPASEWQFPAVTERKESGAAAAPPARSYMQLNSRDSVQLDAQAKAAPAPKAGVSGGTGYGIGNGVGNGYVGGVAAAPPRATETVTVAAAGPNITPAAPAPAAPAPAEKKSAQSDVAVSAEAVATQETTNVQQMPVAVANRALVQTESVMVVASGAVSPQTLVRSPDPQVLWRFSGGRFVERSSDAGATWHVQWTNANAQLLAGVAPASDSCWLVGRAGLILVTVNGKKWKRITPPADVDFVNVTATDASSAIIRSFDGRNFTTSDRGNHWSPAP